MSKKQAQNTNKDRVFFATQNPSVSLLTEALVEHGLAVPVPATRASLLAALQNSGVVVVLMTNSIVPLAKKAQYQANGGSCGDEMAAAFAACDPSEWSLVAKANGVDFGRWSHLNNGQQRMNLGNVLRGKLRRGETVTVGEETFGTTK